MIPTEPKKTIFSPKETKAFKIFIFEMIVIGCALCWIAPTVSGKVSGIVFAALLLPVPPVVLYIYRKYGRHSGMASSRSTGPTA